MDLELAGKVAVVTGSSRGLGLAAARALAREGCAVTLTARGQDGLDAATRALSSETGDESRLLAVKADVSSPGGAADVVARTLERFGRIDVLVNNVGRAGGAGIETTTDDDWQRAIDDTLFPAIRMSRLVVPYMKRQASGVIIMIASIYGREAGGRMTYNAVKAAEIALAKAMAIELAPDGIRVNSIAPGSTLFEGGSWWKRQQENPAAIAEFVKREIPSGRFGSPDEVGAVVAFLASPRASWVTGASIPVDGGQGRSNI